MPTVQLLCSTWGPLSSSASVMKDGVSHTGPMTRAGSPQRLDGALTPAVMKTAIHGAPHLLRTRAPPLPSPPPGAKSRPVNRVHTSLL